MACWKAACKISLHRNVQEAGSVSGMLQGIKIQEFKIIRSGVPCMSKKGRARYFSVQRSWIHIPVPGNICYNEYCRRQKAV